MEWLNIKHEFSQLAQCLPQPPEPAALARTFRERSKTQLLAAYDLLQRTVQEITQPGPHTHGARYHAWLRRWLAMHEAEPA